MNIYSLPEAKSNHYLERYIKLINWALSQKFEGYTEIHHILPKSMYGNNEKHNLVKLPARVHYIAHLMLYKAYRNRQMTLAIMFMTCGRKSKYKKISSRQYENLRLNLSIFQKQNSASAETILKRIKTFKEKPTEEKEKSNIKRSTTMKLRHKEGIKFFHSKVRTEETKNKISASLKGRIITEQAKQNMSKARLGKKPSKETLKKKYKSITTPEGVFESRIKAGLHYSKTPSWISKKVKSNPLDFYYN